MNLEESPFDPTSFSKNRERLLTHEVSLKFFDAVVRQARKQGLSPDDHFTVDGTLIDAWASMKIFQPQATETDQPSKGGGNNPTVDFHGEKRSNQTHQSTTDKEARLMRKGRAKRPGCRGVCVDGEQEHHIRKRFIRAGNFRNFYP